MSADPAPRDPVQGAAVAEAFVELLRRTHLSQPSEIGAIIADQAQSLGARDVALYVVDYELSTLVPLAGAVAPLAVTGTVAGRAFSASTIVEAPDADGGRRLWLPVLDGTERVGAMGMTFPAHVPVTEQLRAICERYCHLAALVLVTKAVYGDAIERARRRRPMTVASELVWGLAPPLVFGTDGVVLAGMLEPCYDNGGDAFDYAVNDGCLHVAVFDAMGHGLAAAGVAAFALAAYRHSRRGGAGLLETHAAMDAAVAEQFPEDRFVTAIIAELDVANGRLTWISAGHPPPLLVSRRAGARARGRAHHAAGARRRAGPGHDPRGRRGGAGARRCGPALQRRPHRGARRGRPALRSCTERRPGG